MTLVYDFLGAARQHKQFKRAKQVERNTPRVRRSVGGRRRSRVYNTVWVLVGTRGQIYTTPI